MLARTVDACEWLFMKQAYETVLFCNFLHYFHGKLVMIGSDICCAVNRSKFVLSRSNFIMLCLCKDSQFPQFLVEISHIFGNFLLDRTEIMIFKFLTLRRHCSEKSTSAHDKVFSLRVKFSGNEEIFLFRAYGSLDDLNFVVSEKFQNAESLLIDSVHGAKQGNFLIESLARV